MRIDKDPGAVLDYTWDWGDWLQVGETITEKDVVADGVTLAEGKPAPAIMAGTRAGAPVASSAVLAWFAGGGGRQLARATCQIITSTGRRDERTITFRITNR